MSVSVTQHGVSVSCGIYRLVVKIILHESLILIWQRAAAVTAGWFEDSTSKNGKKWYA
jgi:hypothetical protein